MEENKGVLVNGVTVTKEEHYKNRLEDVIRKGCTKEELGRLLMDLDMDEDVGGEWLYVHPADRFLFKTVKENDCISVPVVYPDGTYGRADIWDIDVSYGSEGRIRMNFDSLFTVEFPFDLECPWKSEWVTLQVVEAEGGVEKPWAPDGAKMYLDPQKILLIQDLIRDIK